MKTFWTEASANLNADKLGIQTQLWLNQKAQEFKKQTGVKWSYEAAHGGYSFLPEDSGIQAIQPSIQDIVTITMILRAYRRTNTFGYMSYLALSEESDIPLPKLIAYCKFMEKKEEVRRTVNRMGKAVAVKLL